MIDRSDLRTLLNSLCGHKASFLGDYQQLKRKDREDIIDQVSKDQRVMGGKLSIMVQIPNEEPSKLGRLVDHRVDGCKGR